MPATLPAYFLLIAGEDGDFVEDLLQKNRTRHAPIPGGFRIETRHAPALCAFLEQHGIAYRLRDAPGSPPTTAPPRARVPAAA